MNTKERIAEIIAKEIDYMAHEIVVPITGRPSNEYEKQSITKYKRDLEQFANKIQALQLTILSKDAPELTREEISHIWATPHGTRMDASIIIAQAMASQWGNLEE